MRSLTLLEIAESIGAAACPATFGSLTIDQVSTDSRTIRPGDLFWALPGARFDGHDFVEQAFAAGALAAVVQTDRTPRCGLACDETDRPVLRVPNTIQALGQFAAWYRKTCGSTVIAVTGSVGKTSTREAIYAVLSRQWAGVRSQKNYNNEVGVPLSLLEMDPRHRFAVIELGASGPGEIARLTAIATPDIGVLTAIGPAHLEGFGSVEGVARAKAELVAGLGKRSVALLNADDTQIQVIGQSAKCGVLWYGTQDDPYWLFASAQHITAVGDSLSFRLDGGRPVRLRVPGRHQLGAVLAAVAVARWLGLSDREIVRGLENYRPAAMRCEVERLRGVTLINDAYNANPPSMLAALEMLSTWPAVGRRILICGDMLELGRFAAELHRRLGEEIARRPSISCCFAVGPLSVVTVEAARRAGMSNDRVVHCERVDQASDLLCRTIREGDVVLAKASRGMQLERVLDALRRRQAA